MVAWTKTASRTYMATLSDPKGEVSVVIKGVDDLFFVYAKRVGSGGSYKQYGYFHRLGEAKKAVQATQSKVAATCTA